MRGFQPRLVSSLQKNNNFIVQDDFPLASLPLLGYSVDNPDTEDDINKV